MRRRCLPVVTVAVALVLAATACASGGEGGARAGAGPAFGDATAARLRIALPQDRGPVNIFAGIDDRLAELVYDKLLAPSPYVAEPQPWLAEEVRQLDPTTVEARIRRGVTWHDGQPLTASDVKFTFDYYKTAVTGRYTHHVSDVPTIDSVELVDDATVRFRCASPCPDLARITLADLPIIPRHKWEPIPPAQARTVTDLPVGTGPYRLASHSPASGYRFEANPSYFAGAPTVNELVMPVIPDASATFTALRTGEIDAALRALPPELLEEFRRQPGLAVATTKPLQFTELRMNYRRAPFDVAEVRRAVGLAIDRADLLRTVILGQGRVADRGYPHPDSPWTNPRLSTPSDPGEARRIFDGLNYLDRTRDGVRERPDGTPLSFTIKVNGAEPTHLRSGELAAEHLKAVGIRAEVVSLDAGAITQLFTSRDFDLAVSDIGAHGVADPTQFIMSHRSGYLWQAPAVPYPEWDALFERWKATPDVAGRTAVLHEMQVLFNRQPTSVPLYYADEQWAYRPGSFDGWVESPGFGIVHKWSFVSREAAARADAVTQEFRGR